MGHQAADLAHRLAQDAEAVCRHYLSNGRREGRYWLVGDARNTPGRSLFVRLRGPEAGKGAAGKWTDAATGEHGDLLDIIRESCGLADFSDIADEARRFLSLPRPEPAPDHARPSSSALAGSPESARRLFAMSQPISGTIVETYLRRRGITALHGTGHLRFHPRCYYRPDPDTPTETWPAMIAAVTDLGGTITGSHRTWLDPAGQDKAPIDTPRRAMGHLLGNAVRFGVAHDVMAAGEGIETMLSLRCVMPTMPMVAALSAAHLAAILFPRTLRRLYIARDNDPAGDGALANLIDRSREAGIEAITLSPRLGDFNEDLHEAGVNALRAAIRVQIAPEDVVRFMALEASVTASARCPAASASCRIRSRDNRQPIAGEDRAQGLLRGRSGGKRPGQAMADGRLFSAGGPRGAAFASRSKIAGIRHPPLRFGPSLRCGCRSGPPAAFVAMKAAMGAVDPTKGSTP